MAAVLDQALPPLSVVASRRRCANCCTVPTVNPTLARCTRCKLVAYCSKSCQAAHWRASHRAMCAVVRLTAKFRALESAWWRAQPASETRAFEARSGLDAASMVRANQPPILTQ